MTYSAGSRAQVIKSVEQQGMSIRQACVFYDISKTRLQNWLKDASVKLTRNTLPSKTPNDAVSRQLHVRKSTAFWV